MYCSRSLAHFLSRTDPTHTDRSQDRLDCAQMSRSCDGCLRRFVCLCRWEERIDRVRGKALRISQPYRQSDAPPDERPCPTLVDDGALLIALRLVLAYIALRVLGALPPVSVVEALCAMVLLIDGCPLQRVQIAVEAALYALVLQCLPIPTSWYTLAAFTLLGCALLCGGVVCPRSMSKNWSALSIATWWGVTLVTLLLFSGGAPVGLTSLSLRSVERCLSTLALSSVAVVTTEVGDMPRFRYLRAALLSHLATWLVVHSGLIFSLVNEPAALLPQHLCFALYMLALLMLHFWASTPVFVLAVAAMEYPLVVSLWSIIREGEQGGGGGAAEPNYRSPTTTMNDSSNAEAAPNTFWFPWVRFPSGSLVRWYVVHVAQPLWTYWLPPWAVAGCERRFGVALALYGIAKLAVVVFFLLSTFSARFLFFTNVAVVVGNIGCLLSHQQLGVVFVVAGVVGTTLLFALFSAFNFEYLHETRFVSAWGVVSGATTLALLWYGNGSSPFPQGEPEELSPPLPARRIPFDRSVPGPRRRRPR